MKYGFLIDMDGVIYRGKEIIKGGKEFIDYLLTNNIPFLFVTNNSRPTNIDIVLKLDSLGFKVNEKHIYTSALATAKFLYSQKPRGSCYVIGEGGLIKALYDIGYAINDTSPDYVVVGEGRTFTAESIEKAIDLINLKGAKLIATNLDPSPSIEGWMKPGTRAIVAMLEEATGKKAFSVGKPSPILMRYARKEMGLSTDETLIIGDTMETDILSGVQMGYKTILTLTGATKKEDLSKYPYQPHYIIESIADFKNLPFFN